MVTAKTTAAIVNGRLQVQIDLQMKGDAPGHPFRGNQWEGGGGPEGSESGRSSVLVEDKSNPWLSGPKAEKIRAAVEGMPDSVKAMVKAAGIKVEYVDSVESELGNRPIAGIHSTQHVNGVCTPDGRVIVGKQIGKFNGMPNKRAPSVAIHEIGHAYRSKYISESETELLGRLFKEEYGKLDAETQRAMSHYVKNGSESFSRLFEHQYGPGGSAGLEGAAFAKAFSKSLSAFKGMVEDAEMEFGY